MRPKPKVVLTNRSTQMSFYETAREIVTANYSTSELENPYVQAVVQTRVEAACLHEQGARVRAALKACGGDKLAALELLTAGI